MNVQRVSLVHATRPWSSRRLPSGGLQLLCNGAITYLDDPVMEITDKPVTCPGCLAVLAKEVEVLT